MNISGVLQDNNERWKTDGDRSKCRKHAYCSKLCKRTANLLKLARQETVSKAIEPFLKKTFE